jgi:hypothetical protein
MHRLQAAAAAVLVLALHTDTFAAVTLPKLEVVVRVYDVTGMTDAERTAALASAALSFRAAALAPIWIICMPPTRACTERPAAGELVLRLVYSNRTTPSGTTLGDAYLNPQSGGVLATIYIDRVRRVASEVRMALTTLAGYAIAHELGHLLLSSPSHSPRGLMRATWSRREFQRADATDWRFSPEDARKINARFWAMRAENIVWGTE